MTRTATHSEERKKHYELERKLSDRLRHSSADERKKLYSEVYDELYARIPYLLPQQIEISKNKLKSDLRILKPFLHKNSVYLEVGPGNCLFAFAVAEYVAQVYAVDVSTEVTRNKEVPKNFKLIISDGTSIPLSPTSVDIVYSNQLMEHLHPEDAQEQLYNIYRVLKNNGAYLCRTPNRFSGPHDISRDFDNEATGFHLKEYTVTELIELMKKVGFKKFKIIVSIKGFALHFNSLLAIVLEKLLSKLTPNLRRRLSHFILFRIILGINLLAIK